MFEIASLKVQGFRGFVENQEFVFDNPVVLLCGENHRGKSSTLNAIEWCLFGEDCIGKKTGIRERVGWEIANRCLPGGDISVTAEFTSPNGTYKVTRDQSIARRRASQKVTVVLPDGTQLQNDDAEHLLHALFHSSFQDFMTTVYQHQEAIRAILTQEPRERNDAIDRLLGLASYRELMKGIAAAKLEEALKYMDSKREDFRRRCEQAIRTLGNLISEEKAKALAAGIREEDLTEKEALKRAKAIAETIGILAKEMGIVDFQIRVPRDFNEIAKFREWVKVQTDDLWARSPDVLKQETLVKEQEKLITLKGRYEETKSQEIAAQGEREKFVKQFGDEANLVKAAQEQQKNIVLLEGQMRKTNAKANLVSEAIQYLKAIATDNADGQCPLCGANAPNLLSHLQTEWEKKIKEEVKESELRKKECQSKLKELESLKGRLETFAANLGRAHSRREKVVSEIATALGREIKKGDDPLALLGKRLEQIDSELKSASEAIAKKREKISGIYDQLGMLRTIHEILDHEQKRSAIERIWRTKEFTDLEELMSKASQLVEDIRTIKSALAETSREEAEAKIHSAETALDKYFCCIAKHPAIPGLIMEVTEDSRTGLNSYTFKSKDGSDPTPILSQGDLNCLALSLFLGLAEAASETRPFAFIMLDDPTQSLGSEMKRELVGVLEGIADRCKLIIATPDIEFKTLLLSGITKRKVIYSFVDWTEKGGPKITRST